jgi:hypothetical protein
MKSPRIHSNNSSQPYPYLRSYSEIQPSTLSSPGSPAPLSVANGCTFDRLQLERGRILFWYFFSPPSMFLGMSRDWAERVGATGCFGERGEIVCM